MRLARSGVAPVLGILVVLAIWQLVIWLGDIPTYLLVGPIAIVRELIGDPGYFALNTRVTFIEAMLGFGAGVLLGVLSAIAIHYVPIVRSAFYPLLVGLNTIPKVALAPLFIVWFGAGTPSKVVIALLIAFFPVLVSTVDGLSSVPSELRELAKINSASKLQQFRQIDVMYSLPGIFTGMKVSITMAAGGAVVGEFVAGRTGLGFVIIQGAALVNLPAMFAAFLILALMAFVLFLAVDALERVFLPWIHYRE